MKKILAGGLIAALTVLPVTGATAEQIQPLNTTKSTQGADSLQLGGLGASGAITLATIVVGLGIIISGNNSNGTN
ncbi:hypothetical protein [Brevirhabdus sp.]|uniref:hypothetical protein n=1 Tax=Brevirhabdus sp. TaxID=2004514 RepID=UPI004059CF44